MLFNFLVNVLLKFFDIRKAWIIALVVITSSLLLALYTSVTACIDSCIPNSQALGDLAKYVQMGWGLIWNGATASAFSCWVAGWVATTLYIWKKKILDQLVNML